MLKAEILKANESLTGLTEEQIKAIEDLSRKDEDQVIAKRIGELHSDYDKDILEATGIEKRSGEKTYDYLKRAVPEKFEGLKGLESEVEKLKKEKEELLKGGGDKKAQELQKQLDEKISKIELMKDKHAQALKEKEDEILSQQKSMEDFKVDSMFNNSIAGLTFNDTIPEAARKALIETVQSQVKGMSRDWVDDKLVFMDAEGQIMRDKKTLDPITIESFAKSQLESILKVDRPGGGAGGTGGKPGNTSAIDLKGAKNKIELTKAIGDHLAAQGIARGTEEYATKEAELFAEHSNEL